MNIHQYIHIVEGLFYICFAACIYVMQFLYSIVTVMRYGMVFALIDNIDVQCIFIEICMLSDLFVIYLKLVFLQVCIIA